MRFADFLREGRAAATSLMAVFVAIMAVGGAALVSDHVWLVDQRDTLKRASDAAAIAATHGMKKALTDDRPNISDADLTAALQPVARAYVLANLLHLSDERHQTAVDTLVIEVHPDRSQGTVDVSAQADLGGFLFSSMLPFLSGVEQIESIKTEARVESVTNPIEVVLAIDISGSMARDLDGSWTKNSPNSRMEVVKRAASDLVTILNPNAENRVAVGVVPWHFGVRLDQDSRGRWEKNGWAEYPQSRHYPATYNCRPEPGCASLAADQNLPARGAAHGTAALMSIESL